MTIIKKNEDDILYFQLDIFKDINYIDHLFTSRTGWTNESLKENIGRIFKIDKSKIINVSQVHGKDILVVDSTMEDFDELGNLERDGLVTNIPGLALITYHADCVPIYFLDRKKKVIAMAHGGWKGTYNNINKEVLGTMEEVFDSNMEDILVGIGPSIGVCCYQIGEDLGKVFIHRYKKFTKIIDKREGKTYLNLWLLNYLQLLDAGILEENIVQSKACTSCRVDEFHSYRKEKGTKNRMAAAISLK